jgi:hypothetical protein
LEKFGVFLQNYGVLGFSRILGIILLKKAMEYIHGSVDRVHDTALWARSMV